MTGGRTPRRLTDPPVAVLVDPITIGLQVADQPQVEVMIRTRDQPERGG